MKVLSLFSGIGAFEKALKNLGVEYELVGYCEIDKYASKAYSQLHNVSEDKNFGDITKIKADELPKDIDLITYGFPCQDISIAGKQKGFADQDGKTRSGLFFDALRIIETAQPQIAIAENVKNLTSKKFKTEFEIVLKSLEKAGYNNYWKVLNAKHYGIPQNRERVFIVSIRKDIDEGFFSFPQSFPLKLRLKDLLEDNVEEKYYLSGEKAQKLIKTISDNNEVSGRVVVDGSINEPKIKEVANCIISRYDAGVSNQKSTGTMIIEPKVMHVGNITGKVTHGGYAGDIFSPEGLSPTLNTMSGGNRMPFITEPKVMQIGNLIETESFGGNPQRGRVYSSEGCSPALNTMQGGGLEPKIIEELRIRKLTPLECWRLMGFDDEDFNTVRGISNSQLYKQAGNSIVVDVLENIFLELMRERYIA